MKSLTKAIYKIIKENFYLLLLFSFFILVLAVNIRINIFRYDNFDFGKFDLGNMNQMIWNTLNNRFMYLTDYFGTNLPRWSMSHVDPILLLFIPIFLIFPHPMTIVYSQIVIILLSCFVVYKIAYLKLKSKFSSAVLGASFLVYPAVGFITAWTGFHGVSAAIPFFFLAFYVFEKMYIENNFNKKGFIYFWVLLIITMSGKEQIPLYIILYGFFILLFRNDKLYDIKFKNNSKFSKAFQFIKNALKINVTKHALGMMVVGVIWFILAFFVIIPLNASYRIEGFNKFAKSLNIDPKDTRDVSLDNYFLARYEAFGETYQQIILNMLFNPNQVIRIFFGGDRVDSLNKTFGPLAYFPLIYPIITIISLPDLAINYLTSADGIGTSEITNHRISMIIPVLFIATIFAIEYFSNLIIIFYKFIFKKISKKEFQKNEQKNLKNVVVVLLTLIVFFTNLQMTFYSNNPVFLWLDQAIKKRVLAKTADSEVNLESLKIGDVVRLSELENKDRECAKKIVNIIPNNASVSGPDYLGAHLSLRETYAIFPALYNEADYVIVDVFSRKLLTILDVDIDLARDVVEKMIINPNYKLLTGCGNLFVFQKVGLHQKSLLLPLQERFLYTEKVNLPLFLSLEVVDFNIPKEIKKDEIKASKIVYVKRDSTSIEDYVLFLTLVNKKTRELYQIANLPSYSITKLGDWTEDRYYIEDIELAIPNFLDSGDYMFFVGMGNNIRTRSLYLGDVLIY